MWSMNNTCMIREPLEENFITIAQFFFCISRTITVSFFSSFHFTLTVFLRSSGAPLSFDVQRTDTPLHSVAMMQLQRRIHAFFARTPRAGRGYDRPAYLSRRIARTHVFTHLFSAWSVFSREKNNVTHTRRIVPRNDELEKSALQNRGQCCFFLYLNELCYI